MSRKRIQNIIAESRKTLPITIIYGVGVWLLAGLTQHNWWIQLACFFASVYAMFYLNNINMLIRIYSRSVTAAYILLSCITVWLFPSISGGIIQLSSVLILLLLFSCYQDSDSKGITFYIFALISLASLLEPYYLLFAPLVWLLMVTTIYSLGFRSFLASLIGLITPYWLYAGYLLFQDPMHPMQVLAYFDHFTQLQWTPDYNTLNLSQMIYLGLLVVLFFVGSIHFWITSYMDKVRVRQIYASLIITALYTTTCLVILPQEFNVLIYMLTIAVSPIAAHFISLTRSKASNIFFMVLLAVVLLLTGMNLWIS